MKKLIDHYYECDGDNLKFYSKILDRITLVCAIVLAFMIAIEVFRWLATILVGLVMAAG